MAEDKRNAMDVLISIETMLSTLLKMHHAEDITTKVLANRIGNLATQIESMNKNGKQLVQPSFKVEAADTVQDNRNIKIEASLPQIASEPSGNRRTSRTSDTQKPQPKVQKIEEPKEVIDFKDVEPEKKVTSNKGNVPVQQRVLNANNKAVFLASVEIYDKSLNMLNKVRTNGVGKWQASLAPGDYTVKILKQDAATMKNIEFSQKITVSGDKKPITLDDVVIN